MHVKKIIMKKANDIVEIVSFKFSIKRDREISV